MRRIAKHIGLESGIEIRSFGGIQQLPLFLRTLSSTVEFQKTVKALGIARDCETDPQSAKDAVEAAIKAASLDKSITVRVELLPDHTTPGMLESLCLRSVQATPGFACINSFIACVAQIGKTLPTGIHADKHLTQIYLATESDPQYMPGIAAARGAWPFNHLAFDRLKQFLREL